MANFSLEEILGLTKEERIKWVKRESKIMNEMLNKVIEDENITKEISKTLRKSPKTSK